MSYWGYKAYVPVAKRRADAAKQVKSLSKAGQTVSPVVIEGRRIAASFWGKAWCDNLERYSDYANRLSRGRTYVRNGSVIDLSIVEGRVEALVSGSEIYEVRVDIGTATAKCWRAICADCTGSVGSMVELLQGKISKQVMDRVCREGDGLFPAPREIKMACSCPDWAGMCKHIAAVLYGIGARFDANPDALFTLRGVDRNELIALGVDPSMTGIAASNQRVLADDDMAALFGIELEMPLPSAAIAQGKGKMPKSSAEKRPARKSRATETLPDAKEPIKPPLPASRSGKRKKAPLLGLTGHGTPETDLVVTHPAEDHGAAERAADADRKVLRNKAWKTASPTGARYVRLSVRKQLAKPSRSERAGRRR